MIEGEYEVIDGEVTTVEVDWFLNYYNAYSMSLGNKANTRPPIVCEDGFTISVQASEIHMSKPFQTGAEHYTHVEVGYPSQHEETLEPYRNREGVPVYWYVPIEVVEEIVQSHGGILASILPICTERKN